MSLLGFDALGRLAIGQLSLVPVTVSVTLNAAASITGIPTSNYKSILNETTRRLIYAAEISPWTIAR